PFLVSKYWEPMSPMLRYGVFASRWPLADETVWTIVNRNEYDLDGPQMDLPAENGVRYFDLYHGVELGAAGEAGNRSVLSFPIEAHGYGAILATHSAPDSSIQQLMIKMKGLTAEPVAKYAHEWKVLPQEIVPIAKTK